MACVDGIQRSLKGFKTKRSLGSQCSSKRVHVTRAQAPFPLSGKNKAQFPLRFLPWESFKMTRHRLVTLDLK